MICVFNFLKIKGTKGYFTSADLNQISIKHHIYTISKLIIGQLLTIKIKSRHISHNESMEKESEKRIVSKEIE